MAKISSQSYPTTNKIPMSGGTFHVTGSSLITTAYNDRFQTAYNPSIWTKTTTGDVVFTESSSPFSVAATAPAEGLGTYKLLHSKQILSHGNYAIRHSVKLDFNESDFSSKYAYIKFFDGSRSITLSLVYTPEAGYQIEIKRVNSPSGTHTYYYDHPSNFLDILIRCENRHFHFYRNTEDGFQLLAHPEHPQHLSHNDNYNVEIGFIFDSQDLSENQAVYTPSIFDIVPCITGLPLIDLAKVLPATYYSESFASFTAMPGVPGQFPVFISGAGTYIGSAEEAGEVHVLDVRNRESETSLVISPVKTLYTDADPLLVCPEFAYEGQANGGSISVGATCFCDGTEQDETSLDLVFDKGGNTYAASPSDLPAFYFESEGKKYGMNAAYDTLPYDANFNFLNYRVHSFRTLPLKSGKKLYYGALVPDTANFDSPGLPEFTVRVRFEKSLVSQTEDDLITAQVFKQHNSSLIQVGTPYLIQQVASDPVTEYYTLDVEAGFYRIYSTGLRILSVEIKRSSQPDTDYKVIGQMHWAVQASDAIFTSLEYNYNELQNCFHFEVKDPVGRLFYVLHDPCSNIYTSGTMSSSLMSLKTDSYSAAELYDGRIALFYQQYSTRNYTPPGSSTTATIYAPDNIHYRIINQTSNGFADPGARAISSEEFYGLHCFDIAADENNNLTIIFNRERMLDRDSHHNQSYEIVDGAIETSFYNNNPSVKGVKDSPFLHNGFRCMTISASEIDFDNISGSPPTTIINKSSTLIILVTVRELLKTSYYEKGVFLSQPFNIATRSEAGFVKLNYDDLRNLYVISVLDNRRRVPMVMVGKDTNWREIAIPAIKGLDAGNNSVLFSREILGSDSNQRTGAIGDAPVCFSCYNISADFSIDGTIHCFVNQYTQPVEDIETIGENLLETRKEDGCFFVIPCDIMLTPRKLLIEKDEDGNYKKGEVYRGANRQFRFNFLHYYADNIRWTCHVKRDMQYMVNTMGGALRYAMRRLSGIPSEKTSVESELEYFTTFARNQMFKYDMSTGFQPYYEFPNDLITMSEIVRELEEADGIGYTVVRDGAKFRARVSYYTEDYTDVGDTFVFNIKVISVQNTSWFGSMKYIDACIRISSHGVKLIVNDETTPSVLFQVNVDTRKLHDYFIYVKGTQVFFRIDELVEQAGSFDYRRKNVIFYRGVSALASSVEPLKRTSFKINQVGDQTPAWNNAFRLHEAGWSPIRFGVDDAAYTGNSASRSASIVATGYKDIAFKADELFVDNLYPVKIDGVQRISSDYHWPNGFRLSFNGSSAKTKDSFSIARQAVNNVDQALSETLYGQWRTIDDISEVYVWADANDVGLDRFNVECFMVRGCNVPSVVLVGKNSEEDDWTEIETLDLITYAFLVDEYIANPDGQIANGIFDFSSGKFALSKHYFKANGQRAALVKRATGGSVSLKTKESVVYPEEGQVFSSKGYKILDDQVSYRYIGLRIEPFTTYEGYFTLENFDFGLLRSVPLEYNHNIGTGMKLDFTVDSYTVHDENDFYMSNRPRRTYDFSYTLSDNKTLMKMVSAVDKISMSRRPIWIIDGTDTSIDKFSLCLVDSVSSIEPLVEEDGDSYYTFSISLKSLDGE